MKNITLPKILQPYSCADLIRVGKDNDGGYLVNKNDIHNTKSLLSFGIGEDVSFEKNFISLNQCPIYAYDETIGEEHKDFFVDNKTLYHENISMSNIKNILDTAGTELFLNCDIDGGEYDILYELINQSHRFIGVTIEFHDISQYEQFNELSNFISKFELRLIHTHINNYTYVIRQDGTYTPSVIELTFSSSKENTELKRNIPLPHPLDMANNPNDDEFRISF